MTYIRPWSNIRLSTAHEKSARPHGAKQQLQERAARAKLTSSHRQIYHSAVRAALFCQFNRSKPRKIHRLGNLHRPKWQSNEAAYNSYLQQQHGAAAV